MYSLVINFLPSKIAVLKTEAHTRRSEPEYQEDAPSSFHAEAAEGPIQVVAHVDRIHSAATETPFIDRFLAF